MPDITSPERVSDLYIKNDTLSARIDLHTKYSVNKYGFGNWVFDQYEFHSGMRILELGCGTAGIWAGRSGRIPGGVKIVLSDFSPLMVQKAGALLRDDPIFSFEQIDIQRIPYGGNSFDMVIANHVLHHVPDKAAALAEIRRVLRPGGRLYATTMGSNTLAELQAVYHRLEDSFAFSYSADAAFTMQNGAELLRRYFARVERREYIDSLRVTDIDELMAYIKSYNAMPDDVAGEVRALVKAGFSADGVFEIGKEQGMFVCER